MVNPAQIVLLGSTLCGMLTLHFSIQLVSEHFLYWKKPKEQKAIIVIILMAPLYAIDSYVGLVDFQGSKAFFMFLDSVKECYEAFVIAKFLALLYSYLNISISKNIVPDEVKGREIHHSFPMTLFVGIVLDILVALKVIRSHHKWLDVEHIEEALQNMLVCVEMVFFSVYQKHAYGAEPYRDDAISTANKKAE